MLSMNIDKKFLKKVIYKNNTSQLSEAYCSSTKGFQHLKINEFPTLKKNHMMITSKYTEKSLDEFNTNS